MAKVKYKVCWNWDIDVFYEVDTDVLTPELLEMFSEFWAEEFVITTFLRHVTTSLLRNNINSYCPEDSFNKGEEEGMPRLNGKDGITLLKIDGEFSFNEWDMDVEVVE